MKTESEILFEELCKNREVRFSRIKTSNVSRRPDYRIWLDDTEVIIEVKQLEPGEFEEQLHSSGEDPDSPFIPSPVASRIRSKFDKAKTQIRNLAKRAHPALFVIYDTTKGLSGMDSEDFLNAMYGDEIVQVPRNLRSTLVASLIDHRFGGNRKLGLRHNRSVSGFAWLRGGPGVNPSLFIYHSDYADIPINIAAVSRIADAQFRRIEGNENCYRGWKRVDN